MKLDRVPGQSTEAKSNIRRWLHNNKSMGTHNVPRRFNDLKNVKCTVIYTRAFHDEIQAALAAGTLIQTSTILCK